VKPPDAHPLPNRSQNKCTCGEWETWILTNLNFQSKTYLRNLLWRNIWSATLHKNWIFSSI